MRFNARGDLVAGVAGGTLSVNTQPVGTGGGPKWRTEDDFLANALGGDGRYGLESFARPTWAKTTVNVVGATRIGAGGGNYAASLASNPPITYGEVDGIPLSPPETLCAVLDGADDGGLLFVRRDGSAFIARWADGTLEAFPIGPHVNFDSVRMVPDEFLYLEEPRTLWLQVHGQPRRAIPTVDTPFEATTIIAPDDTRWFLYHNDATYLQREDEAYGYRFMASFSPDVWVNEAGLCQVALTDSPGEAPDRIVIESFVLGQGAGPLVPPVPPIQAFPWPVLIAPFKDPTHQSGCPVAAEDLGLICETEDSLPAIIAQAEAQRKRVIFIWDHPQPPVVPPQLRAWDQFWIEAYRAQGETLDDSYRRWASNLWTAQAKWSGDLGVVAMFYLQGGAPPNELWTVDEVLAANRLMPQLLAGTSRVKVVAPFAYERLNGIVAHPELQTRLVQYRAATPGTPVFVPIPPNPVYSTGGAILMADITGVIQHYGITPYGKQCTLKADAAGLVVSVQPNGSLGTRPPGTHGGYELGVLDGQIWSVRPTTAVVYSFVITDISNL